MGPEGWGPEGWGGQNFALFFPPATIFFLSSLSWGSFRGILVGFVKRREHVMCTFGLSGRPTPPKFHEKTHGERGTKSAKFSGGGAVRGRGPGNTQILDQTHTADTHKQVLWSPAEIGENAQNTQHTTHNTPNTTKTTHKTTQQHKHHTLMLLFFVPRVCFVCPVCRFFCPATGAPPFGAPGPLRAPPFLGTTPFGAPPFGPTFSRFGPPTIGVLSGWSPERGGTPTGETLKHWNWPKSVRPKSVSALQTLCFRNRNNKLHEWTWDWRDFFLSRLGRKCTCRAIEQLLEEQHRLKADTKTTGHKMCNWTEKNGNTERTRIGKKRKSKSIWRKKTRYTEKKNVQWNKGCKKW